MNPTSADISYVARLARQLAGAVIEGLDEPLVKARLHALAVEAEVDSPAALLSQLRATPVGPIHRRVVEAFLNAETWFFRDGHPFDTLRRHVFPEIMIRRAIERRLTIWSAACASGQEPYSIAMLLREHFPALTEWSVTIVASDFSRGALRRAQEASYNQIEVNRGLSAWLLVKYFEPRGLGWDLKPEIRKMVDFQEVNLVEDLPPLPAVDVVLLRNVMIYFDAETKKAVLDRVIRAMRPDAYLVLGSTEMIATPHEKFERVTIDRTVCYRRNGLHSAPPARDGR